MTDYFDMYNKGAKPHILRFGTFIVYSIIKNQTGISTICFIYNN